MKYKVERLTADLSAFPSLVVIYFDMRVYSLRGLKTLLRFGPRISQAVAQKPEAEGRARPSLTTAGGEALQSLTRRGGHHVARALRESTAVAGTLNRVKAGR